MKQSVINGIGWAAKGYESHELQSFLEKPRPSGPAEPDKLEELLKSIGVDLALIHLSEPTRQAESSHAGCGLKS